jgi:tRNA(Ile)-lysidine synthase
VLNGYLEQDLLSLVDAEGRLRWQSIVTWPAARQGQLLRNWIRQQGHRPPSRKVLERILVEMFTPREDAMPQVSWGPSIMRRYRDHLYLEYQQQFDTAEALDWNPQRQLKLEGLGSLHMAEVATGGLPAAWLAKPWQIRFRQGGEVVQREGEAHHLSLKKLYQDAAIPPWQRERLPLLYCDGELVFIPGVFQKMRLRENQAGLLPVWQPFSTAN